MKTVTIETEPGGVRLARFCGEPLVSVGENDDVFHAACVALHSRGVKGRVRFLTKGARVLRTMDIAEGAEHREYRDPDDRPYRRLHYPFGAISSSSEDGDD